MSGWCKICHAPAGTCHCWDDDLELGSGFSPGGGNVPSFSPKDDLKEPILPDLRGDGHATA